MLIDWRITFRKVSKNLAYMVKMMKYLVRIISEHLLKATFLMFQTKTVEPFLVWKLKWGGGPWPPWPPKWLRPC